MSVKLRNDGEEEFKIVVDGVEYSIPPHQTAEVPDKVYIFSVGITEEDKRYVRMMFGKIPPLVRVDGRKKEKEDK